VVPCSRTRGRQDGARGRKAGRREARAYAREHRRHPADEGRVIATSRSRGHAAYFIRAAHNRSTLVKPRIIIAFPGSTEVERRAVREAAKSAGGPRGYLIEQPIAAAIGAGLPITEPSGNMIVDIGGGTSDVAVISLAGIVCAKSVRIGGDRMDEAIIQHIKRSTTCSSANARPS